MTETNNETVVVQDLEEFKEKLRELLKSVYFDYVPEFETVMTTNDAGNNVVAFVSSMGGIMVSIYDKDDEDQDDEIGGGIIDGYEEGYEVTEADIEKQIEFILETAEISTK